MIYSFFYTTAIASLFTTFITAPSDSYDGLPSSRLHIQMTEKSSTALALGSSFFKSASKYFSGRDLVLANAIESGEIDKMGSASKGLNLNALHAKDMSFLFFAMHCEQEQAVTELIRLGANPALAVPNLGSPLGNAVRSEDRRWLKVFLKAGISPDAMDASQEPLVWGAVEAPNVSTLKVSHKAGANLNARDTLDAAPIYVALSRRKFEHVRYLIHAGADINFSTVNGVTMGNAIERQIARAKPNTPLRNELKKIKNLLKQRGFSFPAEPIEAVRKRRKKSGLPIVD
jgi:hypothetical protein